MQKTNIDYLDYSWNPIKMRCTPITQGCTNCWHIGYCDRHKNNTTNLNGGFRNGKRIMFAAVYMQAIRNLHKEYGKLDFMLTHSALGCVYGLAQSKKYYRQARIRDEL